MLLFSERSLWTMVHGIVLGGGAMMALAAALFAIYIMRPVQPGDVGPISPTRAFSVLTTVVAFALWMTVIVGTYIVFPPYRATPPEGTSDLTNYPRSLILSDPETTWLHAFAMETKEHVPFIAAMLATAVAFVAWRYGPTLMRNSGLRRMTATLLLICIGIVSYISLLGVFVNKVAPLE
jgi:hypothetical protein